MSDLVEVRVPDIGDFDEVEVVELLVGPGDRVDPDDSLVSIESDKATMEIPSPVAGVVETVHVALGDMVSEGALIAELSVSAEQAVAVDEAAAPATEAPSSAAAPNDEAPAPEPAPLAQGQSDAAERLPGEAPPREPPIREERAGREGVPHASPGVRRFARELGVDLARASGSGPHGRVLEADVKGYVRESLQGAGVRRESAAPPVDASRFGPVHEEPLGKIRRVSARNLSESWRAPHVTQHDEADLTDLEVFRKSVAEQARERGVKLSPLHFVMKAVAIALQDFPDMRSSLSAEGDALVVRDYVHLGIAVDTDHGLVVPVVRDVDRKGIFTLAEDLAALAERARARKLGPADMQGAVFTISSLGGIGGTAFTPIVNAPEVGILGLSKLLVRPVWSAGLDVHAADGHFEPRIVLPLSLSYDHRVIDGAVAVRFTTRLVALLSHPAHLLL